MSLFYTSEQIDELIREEKLISLEGYQSLFKLKDTKASHKEQSVEIKRSFDDDSFFKIIIRQNENNLFDFSVIFAIVFKNNNQIFKLRRYNGKSHRHRNKIENEKFYDYHIHQATERYQIAGSKEETFAQTTELYTDLRGAIYLMMRECNIIEPEGLQQNLF